MFILPQPARRWPLSWYTAPGGLPQGASIQTVVQIPEVIRYATTRLMWGQAIGRGIEAVLGLVLSLMSGRKPPVVPAPPPV